MAVEPAARVKAAQIRKRVAEGKHISPDAKRFIDLYTIDTAQRSKRALPRGASSSAEAREMTMVQSTDAQNENVDPAKHTWMPTVPKAPDDAPAPPAGAAPETPIGSPVVDATPPTGDPKAALQAAVLAALIMRAGIKAALELLADVNIPDEIRAIANDPATQNDLVGQVAAAAHRLALKYNVSSVPMTDEMIVSAAMGASALAYVALYRKRRKAAAAQGAAKRVATAAPTPGEPRDPELAPVRGPAAGLWS